MPQQIDLNKQLKHLCDEIETHDTAYYANANPLISDYEYDQLVTQAAAIRKKLGISDTSKVGDDRAPNFKKVKRTVPMLSINNTYSPEDLKIVLEKLKGANTRMLFAIEHKIDGVAVSLEYRNARLYRASTRGNGVIGDDITENVKAIHSIPNLINTREPVEIRGEIYSRLSKFEKINTQRAADGLKLFANARNMCAGTIKLTDPVEVARRDLDACFYTVVDPLKYGITTHRDELAWIMSHKLHIPELTIVGGVPRILKIVRSFRNGTVSTYPTDGLVIKINDLKLQQAAGYTHKAPKGVIAYKCEPDHAWTTLNAVTWQIGRTGAVTPVGEIDTTELSGSLISRATLHNLGIVKQLDLHIGDSVDLVKAGEIIPKILKVDVSKRRKGAVRVVVPRKCPTCRSTLNNSGTGLYCLNRECGSRIRESLEFYVSDKCMGIDGLGGSRIQVLLDCGLVEHFTDLYDLTVEDLTTTAGFGPNIATAIIEAIELSKTTDPIGVLTSLGIYGIGTRASRALLEHFGSITNIANASEEDIIAVRSIGSILAGTIYKFFNHQRSHDILERMRKIGLQLEPVDVVETKVKRRYVITGRVPGMSRRQIGLYLSHNGCVLDNSVTKLTDVLIIGESPRDGKLRAAKKLSTPTMTPEEFVNLVNQ